MHLRVSRYRGPAKQYQCWDCARIPAQTGPTTTPTDLELIKVRKGRRVAYSIDVMHYRALCRRCHSLLDAGRRVLLRTARVTLYEIRTF